MLEKGHGTGPVTLLPAILESLLWRSNLAQPITVLLSKEYQHEKVTELGRAMLLFQPSNCPRIVQTLEMLGILCFILVWMEAVFLDAGLGN